MSENKAFSLLQSGVQEAVWAMGWTEFRQIQTEGIHCILESEDNLLIAAQTAGGKTEACFLPIISKLVTNTQPSIQALYIGPLKALINDQFQRLATICSKLAIPVHRWHGDVSATDKAAVRKNPSGILLITPESLESNFINFGALVPKIYRGLDFVVIDELHSYLDNVRGIHLRSLLSRLYFAIGRKPRTIGLSATLGDPKAARPFLAPDNPESVRILSDSNSEREIKLMIKAYVRRPRGKLGRQPPARLEPLDILKLADSSTASGRLDFSQIGKSSSNDESAAKISFSNVPEDALDEIAKDITENFARSTNLVFVNRKQTLEELAVKIRDRVRMEKWARDPFVVHHGSVSRQLREEAEAALRDPDPTTALCSSTLEMGIDIGSVRAIGQVDPPWSVSSMVQRLGRSGRREGEPSIMRMYVSENSPTVNSSLSDLLNLDLVRAVAITQLMLQKWLEPPDLDRMHLSTLVHQILSCLKQTGGMQTTSLYQTLIQRGPFRNISSEQFAQLLKGLATSDLVSQMSAGELILGLAGERIASAFDFYAAFKTTEEFSIRFNSDEIGKLPVTSIPPVGEHLVLAGQRWRVEDIDPGRKIAFVVPAPGGKTPIFGGDLGETHTVVARQMKTVLCESTEPTFINEPAKILLRAGRRIAKAAGLHESNFVSPGQKLYWFPWVGTRCLRTLSLAATACEIKNEIQRFAIEFVIDSREQFRSYLKRFVDHDFDAEELAALLPVRTFEKFDELIPISLLNLANARDHLNVAEATTVAESAFKNFES